MKKVQIQSSVYWAEPWLNRFLTQIENLDYPKEDIRYAFVTAPNPDNTLTILFDWLKNKHNFYLRQIKMPSDFVAREKMWMSGNFARLFATTPMKGDWLPDFVFICDCDVIKIPPNTLRRLVELDLDIVAPYVYVNPESEEGNPVQNQRVYYDTYATRFLYGPYSGTKHPYCFAEWYAEHIENPDIQADLEKKVIPMMSVGANPVLIRRQVLEQCWYEGNEAIVGFCNLARQKGFKIWSYPEIETTHSWRSIYTRPDELGVIYK